MAAPVVLTPEQRQREHSILLSTALDSVMNVVLFLIGVAGGSHTILAESIRGTLGWLLECFSLVVLRRIHRGVLVDMEYGSGKLEQVASSLVGASMLGAAAWIAIGAVRLVLGEEQVGTPLGLAAAAAAGMVNVCCNLVAWDAVRRAADRRSVVMQAQLTSRIVKLVASLIVQVTLTIAAISTDAFVVAWADAIGSLFVSVYVGINAVRILHGAIADIVDRSAGPQVASVVAACLAQHGDDGWQARRVRTRRSGHVAFIEIALAFAPDLTIAEIDRRSAALRAALRAAIADADISIVAAGRP